MSLIGFLEINDEKIDGNNEAHMTLVECEIAHELRRIDRKNWAKAIWMTLTTMRGELEGRFPDREWFRGVWLKALLLLAMIFWREEWECHYGESVDMGHFDYCDIYGGWEATVVWFNPKRLRYEIFQDGETSL